ncbi:hypothetical protein [Thiothrix winogradskyi]|uniref:Uncharacterized protein n=1 Tax=Thiothrix winogradskyi TaxID=96472 RepID=A0ABY3T7J8_9GAMM|nr:hypothetical protein [Thiothrix winogradskyi]UJS26258.1 hypothetical protein L2Y54_09525 [Thiothrix winogradskyi]
MQSIQQNDLKPNQINASSPISGGDCQPKGYRLAHMQLTTKRVDCNGVTATYVKPTLCLIINGEIRRVSDWAALHGVNAHTLRSRAERGFPLDELFVPPHQRPTKVNPKAQAKRDQAAAEQAKRDTERRRFSRLLDRMFAPCVRGGV